MYVVFFPDDLCIVLLNLFLFFNLAEAWVTKGENFHKRIDIKGRGRFGIKYHPEAKMSVVLREGKTVAELKKQAEDRKLRRIVSAGYAREDVPLRNMGPMWSW